MVSNPMVRRLAGNGGLHSFQSNHLTSLILVILFLQFPLNAGEIGKQGSFRFRGAKDGATSETGKTYRSVVEDNSNKVKDSLQRDTYITDDVKKSMLEVRDDGRTAIKHNRTDNFFILGATMGTPAGGNINMGYYFSRMVIRASGAFYNKTWNGYQGDIGYSFWKTSTVAHSVSIVGGGFIVAPFDPQVGAGGQNSQKRTGIIGYQNQPVTLQDNLIRSYIGQISPDTAVLLDYYYRTRQKQVFNQNYIGITYDLFLGGFFLQLGAGSGRGDYKNPQLLFQVGYIYDFR